MCVVVAFDPISGEGRMTSLIYKNVCFRSWIKLNREWLNVSPHENEILVLWWRTSQQASVWGGVLGSWKGYVEPWIRQTYINLVFWWTFQSFWSRNKINERPLQIMPKGFLIQICCGLDYEVCLIFTAWPALFVFCSKNFSLNFWAFFV